MTMTESDSSSVVSKETKASRTDRAFTKLHETIDSLKRHPEKYQTATPDSRRTSSTSTIQKKPTPRPLTATPRKNWDRPDVEVLATLCALR